MSAEEGEESDSEEWGALVSLFEEKLVTHTDKEVLFHLPATRTATPDTENQNICIRLQQSPSSRAKAAIEDAGSNSLSESSVSTGAVVWDGAVVLARYIEYNRRFYFKSETVTSVIELGAGCGGLPGIVSAVLGGKVTLTDAMPGVLEILKLNLTQNQLIKPPAVEQLNWLTWDRWFRELSTSFEMVLVGDCVYDLDLVPALVCTMHKCVSEGGVILCTIDTSIDRNAAVSEFKRLCNLGFDNVQQITRSHEKRGWLSSLDNMYGGDSETVELYEISGRRNDVVQKGHLQSSVKKG
eukprot:m.66759 g.66759  ORF g.66759 m.66759 type:complete len:296 (-) comp11833_c0_seq3:637-1524(-)